MERLRNLSLIPIVSLTVLLSILTAVLLLIGFPWAGVGSAITCAAVATGLTISLAIAFAHGPDANHS